MLVRLSKRNPFPNFSIKREYQKLDALFHDTRAFSVTNYATYHRKYFSYYDVLNNTFLQWEYRGSDITLEEMMISSHISDEDFSNPSEEKLLYYIQFLFNAITFLKQRILNSTFNICQEDLLIEKAMIENCYLLLDKLKAEVRQEYSEWYVVYKNDVASAVSVQHPELEARIIDYLKLQNGKNLERKKEILGSLSNDLETKEKEICDKGFKQLCSDTTFLLNKAGIRHELVSNDKQKAFFLALDEQGRIKWYDRIFEMFLACMAELPYLKYKDEIEKIRKI